MLTATAGAAGAPSLLLVHDFPPIGGGVARAMGELARHATAGQLIVSTGRQSGSEAFDATCPARIDRVQVPSERLRQIAGLARWAFRARALARESGAAFVWAGNLKPAGHVARWLAARDRLPYGLIVYGLDLNRIRLQASRSPIKRRAARGIIGNASGTVAISAWTADTFRSLALELGLPEAAERVRMIPLGVDPEMFRPSPDRESLRRRLGLSGPRRWALTVVRLVPHKGVDVALRLVAELAREGMDLGYLVVGEGPERAALERQAESLGIADRVRWLGRVPDEELPGYYAAADLYLGLSREEGLQAEGFGLALLEAQAAGLPLVAGRSGGTADAVADGISGLLLPPTDLPAILGATRGLLLDDPRARAMGRAGRLRAEREFGWTRVLGDFEAAAAAFRTPGPGVARGRAGR
ncbi:MAG: glycosyltransferase family 4 protein [Gemmatimonadota bacterium]